VDVNAKDRRGQTALDWAKQYGKQEIVDLLKKHGALEEPGQSESQRKDMDRPKSEHDVGVVKVAVPSVCKQGDIVNVTITVANHGTFRESFSVALGNQTDGNELKTKKVTLAKKWTGQADDVPDLTFTAEIANGPCAHGDINGDGVADILVAAPGWNDETGRVCLYYGSDRIDPTKPNIVFSGKSPGDWFGGHSGVYTADLNKDGYDDVIIGALNPGGKGDGHVFIHYGGPDIDNTPDIILDGEPGQSSWFGGTITASDIDQDGFVDLLVGAQNYDHGGAYKNLNSTQYGFDNGRGRVYLYWGGDTMDTTADIVFEGEKRGNWFGRRIDADGDINGDGYNDILIGARESQGRAYLFLGNTKEQMDSEPDWTFKGSGWNDNMGSSVDIFDIDNDGIDDVLVGARFASGASGRVYIYWGSKEFDAENPDVVLEGQQKSGLGSYIECGHFNDDPYGDILIGAARYPNYWHGRAYMFYGNSKTSMDTSWDYIFAGQGLKENYFGFGVSAGDVNGDGHIDALMCEEGAGRTCLFYGPFHATTDITFTWDTSNASIGKHALKVEIQPVPGEQNTKDNVRIVIVEIKEALK
jgi:hypothetical protein